MDLLIKKQFNNTLPPELVDLIEKELIKMYKKEFYEKCLKFIPNKRVFNELLYNTKQILWTLNRCTEKFRMDFANENGTHNSIHRANHDCGYENDEWYIFFIHVLNR